MRILLNVCGASLTLALCLASPAYPREAASTIQSSVGTPQPGALPPPAGIDLTAATRPYLIGPFDRLIIDVFGIPELTNKEIMADAGGNISFPLAGVIEAAGKTPGQLEEILRQRLAARGVRDPQVTVNLKETVSQTVTVDGEVKEPGLYPVLGRMTLMRAVATAKGAGEFAKLTDVVIFRTVNGQQMAGLYNLRAIRRGYYEDPEVFANDVVIVGNSPGKRLFKDALQVFPLLTTPLILLLRK